MNFKGIILLVLWINLISFAQSTDSLEIKKILLIENNLDSLRLELKALQFQLDSIKRIAIENEEFKSILAVTESDSASIIPEDQRSSNVRLDNLLKAMTNRPGQIKFNGGALGLLHAKVTDTTVSAAVGLFDFYATTSFGNNSLVFLQLQAKGGDGLDPYINPFVPTDINAGSMQLEGEDIIFIPEAWVEFFMFDETVTVTAGKIDLNNYFDNNQYANDEYSQFLNGNFVNSPALPFPVSSAGLRIRTTFFHRLFFQAAVASADNSGDKIFSSLIKAASIGFKFFIEEEWENNVRIYGYLHPDGNNKEGLGVSFDQKLFGLFGLFFRWNRNHDQLAEWLGIISAYSFGLDFKTYLSDHSLTFGAGYGETKPFDKSLKKENVIESYLRYQINKWVFFSMHAQFLTNTGGTNTKNSLLSLRTQFNF